MNFFYFSFLLFCFHFVSASTIYSELFKKIAQNRFKTNQIGAIYDRDQNTKNIPYRVRLAQSFFDENVREILDFIQKEKEDEIFRQYFLPKRKSSSFISDFHVMRY